MRWCTGPSYQSGAVRVAHVDDGVLDFAEGRRCKSVVSAFTHSRHGSLWRGRPLHASCGARRVGRHWRIGMVEHDDVHINEGRRMPLLLEGDEATLSALTLP